MSKKLKSTGKKKISQQPMRDRYWKQVMIFAGQRQWQELGNYVDNYPWLATTFMGPSILPDYLAAEKEYSLLRLLCNVEDVPLEVVRKIILLGARDKNGRAYLERLLAGTGADETEADHQLAAAADSPLVAAEVLKTCEYPEEVIDRIHQVLEQGLGDADPGRKAMAERCIGRSKLFHDLLMLLYENDATDLLQSCLGRRKILELAGQGELKSYMRIKEILAEQ